MTVAQAGTTFDSVSGTHAVSASFTADDIIVVFAVNSGVTAPPLITDSHADGLGTYSIITDAFHSSNTEHLFAYIRDSRVGSTASCTVTIGGGSGEVSTGGGGVVIRIAAPSGGQWTGVEGISLVRQSGVQDNQSASSTPTVTMSKTMLSDSIILGAVANLSSPAGMTPPSGYTEIQDSGYSTPTTGLESVYKDTGASGTTVTWGSTSASAYADIAVEIYPTTYHKKDHSHLSRYVTDVYDDCYYYTVECWDGGIRQVKNGTGSDITDAGATYTDTGHFGILELATGTTSIGYAGLGNDTLDTIILGSADIKFGCIAKVPTLSATEAFNVYMGFSADPYYFGTSSRNVVIHLSSDGTNIIYETSNGSTTTTQTSGFTQDTGWHRYEITYNATTGYAGFSIDGGSGYAWTTNIPTGTVGLLPAIIVKSANTTSRSLLVDAYWYEINFRGAR